MILPVAMAVGVIAMVCRDAAVEFQTIAQVKGRAGLAALLGPVSTLTGIAVTVVGAGPVIQHGLTPHAGAILASILATDVVDGYVFTKLGTRIGGKRKKLP